MEAAKTQRFELESQIKKYQLEQQMIKNYESYKQDVELYD